MRVSALIVYSGLAALLAGGCAPYRYVYDHRDELHRQDQARRPERFQRTEQPRRLSAPAKPPTAKQRSASVAVAKPTATPVDKPAREAGAAAPRKPELDGLTKPTAPAMTARAQPAPADPVPAPPPAAPAAAPAVAGPAEPPRTIASPGTENTTAAAPAVAPSPAARKDIADGYRLLRAGFVKKARERFAAAMPTAAAEATLGEARSMDPSYLASVAFPDVEPDAEQARRLYRRALMLGASEAKSDLERLESASATAARNAPSAQ
ncbi:MAG: hypothetical protein ACK4MF_01190 [Hyphomicrobiaceae bacterium]